jgi:hypothetical protein
MRNGLLAVALVRRIGWEDDEPAVDREGFELDAEAKEPLIHPGRERDHASFGRDARTRSDGRCVL